MKRRSHEITGSREVGKLGGTNSSTNDAARGTL